jgi:hypothetical protein
MLDDGVWGPQIPVDIAFALAELFDPHSPTSPYVKRSESAEAQSVTAGIEVGVAHKALMVECERLVKTYNAQVNRLKALSSKPSIFGEDMITLRKFAEERGDQKAVRVFADHSKAANKFWAAMQAINPGVRLRVEPLTKERRDLLRRNSAIVGEMLAATLVTAQSVGDAANAVGEKLGVSPRQIHRVIARKK